MSYGKKAELTVKMVVCHVGPDWKAQYFNNLLNKNKIAIQRGVKFTHIWILDDHDLANYDDILSRLVAIGIEIRLASPSEVPQRLIDSYRIVDNYKVVHVEFRANGSAKTEAVYINPILVQQYCRDFDNLLHFTRPYDNIVV